MFSKLKDPLRSAQALQKTLKLKFRKPSHLVDALVHTSFTSALPEDGPPAYERLEFFGDSILNFAICDKLYHSFPEDDDGALSQLRSMLVSKKMLSRIAKKLRLEKFIVSQESDPRNIAENSKLLADSLEALIGAIYLDRGLKTVCEFVWKNWKDYFDTKKLNRLNPNPKSALQEIVQKIFKMLPSYETKPEKKNGFAAVVSVQKKYRGKGKGLSKQEAEEEAAQNLLAVLRKRFKKQLFSPDVVR